MYLILKLLFLIIYVFLIQVKRTDVTLSDRVENYYQNISLCDRDCNYEVLIILQMKQFVLVIFKKIF